MDNTSDDDTAAGESSENQVEHVEIQMDVDDEPLSPIFSEESAESPISNTSEEIDTDDPMTDSEDDYYHEEDDDEDLTPPPPIPLPPISAALSTNSVWSTIIPSAFSFGARGRTRGKVSKMLRVFSVAMLPHPRPELENGGKMILPPSFLSALTQGNSQLNGPMLFRVANNSKDKVTHCGVLEFIADEGKCYMPYWRMHNIGANEGDVVNVENTTAEVGKYALFQPQSVDFLDISNPTALLENALRNFACITKGETIVIHYNSRIYELKVLDTKPTDAINIIECDMDVDFAPAVGLPPQSTSSQAEEEIGETNAIDVSGFVAFAGAGSRLNGKPVQQTSATNHRLPRGQPDFQWKVGKLTFIRKPRRIAPASATAKKEAGGSDQPFTAFKGTGVPLNFKSQSKNGQEFKEE